MVRRGGEGGIENRPTGQQAKPPGRSGSGEESPNESGEVVRRVYGWWASIVNRMKLPSWHASGDRDKAWKNSMGGLGRRLLAGMGWKEGQTLGKRGNENGLVKCLQPDAEDLEKRVKGIGADKSIHSSNWWEQAFNTAAVSIVGKKSKSKSSSKKRKAEKEAKKKEGKKIKSKPKVGGGRHGRRS